MNENRYQSFEEFWPYYLSEHSHPVCRILHFVGTTLALAILVLAPTLGHPLLGLVAPIVGYGFAWVGHFFVERNRPATFSYPLWSFYGDFRMWSLMLRGRLWSRTPVLD